MLSCAGSCTFCFSHDSRMLSCICHFYFSSLSIFWLTKSGAPVPLATKVYYSQRNHRFRSAISHLYFAASNEEHSSDLVRLKVLQGNMAPQLSLPKNFSHEQMDSQLEKRVCHSSFSEQSNCILFWYDYSAACSEHLKVSVKRN